MSKQFEIIPAIDLIDGKCVRLSQGNYEAKTIYNENPVEVAKSFEAIGIKRLHVVDLDGAKAGKIINIKTLEQISAATNLEIDFGGGVKTETDIELVLNAGAKYVTIGSMAVKQQELVAQWLNKYGFGKFFLGIDVKGEFVATNGWLETSTKTIYDVLDFYNGMGFNYFFCTDISKDGMLQGISEDLYSKVISKYKDLNLVASGGVSSVKDMDSAKRIGCSGAIVGKAIYENRITNEELKSFL
ncbi:MAG: 1-(5-phosphoribosyl)-5-[(5-phosphoribosylamino)methylideneamino]imidazole-4-carboxamide isomerase [Bacteroidia bacterium]